MGWFPNFSTTEKVESKDKVDSETDENGFFKNLGEFSKNFFKPEDADDPDVNFGDRAKGQAGEIMALGADTYNNFNTVAKTSEERKGNIIKGAFQGGKIGMALGGPGGAVLGAGVMAGINAIDAKADKLYEIDRKDKETREDFNETKDERAKVYNRSESAKQRLGFSTQQYGLG